MTKMKNALLRIRYNSPVVLTFAILSLAVLLMDLVTNGAAVYYCFSVYRSSLNDPLSYVRLFGHVLGHSSFEHYISNMMLFLIVGPSAETKYGSANLLTAFALTAAVSGLLHCLLSPDTALLGASGIVFMLILLSAFEGSDEEGTVPLTLILVALMYIGQEIYTAVTVEDSISQLAHIAGGGCGIVLGFVLRNVRGKK